MAFPQVLNQIQTQKQIQKMSQRQIQAVNMLAMSSKDLREEIYKAVQENPAIEIVKDIRRDFLSSGDVQAAIEAHEDKTETLQSHLMSQLNMSRVNPDEYEICQKLIYNLDKNGCYGSMLDPRTLLDKSRPLQTESLLQKCIERVQRMDPIGTCCKSLEESLYVQAKINGDASELTGFLLEENHLELLTPPVPEKILQNLKKYKEKWHSKAFAPEIYLDKEEITLDMVKDSLDYILHLNPHPAGEFISDSSRADFNGPDIVLSVEKKEGNIPEDDFSRGMIKAARDFYFQVKYASGALPEVRLSKDVNFDRDSIEKAKAFIENLLYRQNSIVLQGCMIVKKQIDFFVNGPGHLVPLTRRTIARALGVHESTVSRMANKKNSKYIQTEFGLFPASYFFSSGVKGSGEQKISSSVIKSKIMDLIQQNQNFSDNQLCAKLNEEGIKIARRTVAKYRQQIGLENSYRR